MKKFSSGYYQCHHYDGIELFYPIINDCEFQLDRVGRVRTFGGLTTGWIIWYSMGDHHYYGHKGNVNRRISNMLFRLANITALYKTVEKVWVEIGYSIE